MGKKLFSCGIDDYCNMYDTETGEVQLSFKGHSKSIKCIKLNTNSSRLFTGSADSTTKIWNVATGECLMTC